MSFFPPFFRCSATFPLKCEWIVLLIKFNFCDTKTGKQEDRKMTALLGTWTAADQLEGCKLESHCKKNQSNLQHGDAAVGLIAAFSCELQSVVWSLTPRVYWQIVTALCLHRADCKFIGNAAVSIVYQLCCFGLHHAPHKTFGITIGMILISKTI